MWMKHSRRERVEQVFKNTHFDPNQNLREKTDDEKKVLNIIFELEEYMEQDTLSLENELFATEALGDLYRVINKPDESIHYHSENLRLISEDENKQVPAFIRLGVSYIYADELKKALLCFEKAETIINRNNIDEYTDLLEYQRGKCYLEMRYYNWAKDAFESALNISSRKNNPELIGITREALEYCNEKLNAQV